MKGGTPKLQCNLAARNSKGAISCSLQLVIHSIEGTTSTAVNSPVEEGWGRDILRARVCWGGSGGRRKAIVNRQGHASTLSG